MEIADEASGMTYTDCGKEAQKLQDVCFKEPSEVLDSCLASGGVPTSITDGSGCPVTKCAFLGSSDESVFLESNCPSDEQVNLLVQECTENGLGIKMEESLSGCFMPKCVGKEQKIEQACPAAGFEEAQRVEETCAAQGGVVEFRYDNAGCKSPVCVSQAISACYAVPKEAKEVCAKHGGEMVILKDNLGCVTYSYCLTESTGEFDFEPILGQDLASLQERNTLLADIGKLSENLSVVVEKIGSLKEFYANSGDEENLKKATVAQSMLNESISRLQEISGFLQANKNSFTVSDATKARLEFGAISENIKGILEVLLKQVPLPGHGQSTDCGSSVECFKKNFLACTPSTVSLIEDVIYRIKISGLEGERCAISISADLVDGQNSMVCKYKDFSSGFEEDNLTGFLDSCEGSLLDFLLQKGV